jgi:hypothetical protein
MLYCVQTTMNINTSKILTATLLAHLMCVTVVLSHIHAKDAVSLMRQHSNIKLSSNDITAKALGDLHHHIDKASLKNITADTSTTAARTRELNPLDAAVQEASLMDRLHDFLLRFRVVTSLCYQYV